MAVIEALADFGSYQGQGAHLVIGQGERAICNSFDDRDIAELGRIPFRSV
jgi:hypothetical protein